MKAKFIIDLLFDLLIYELKRVFSMTDNNYQKVT